MELVAAHEKLRRCFFVDNVQTMDDSREKTVHLLSLTAQGWIRNDAGETFEPTGGRCLK